MMIMKVYHHFWKGTVMKRKKRPHNEEDEDLYDIVKERLKNPGKIIRVNLEDLKGDSMNIPVDE